MGIATEIQRPLWSSNNSNLGLMRGLENLPFKHIKGNYVYLSETGVCFLLSQCVCVWQSLCFILMCSCCIHLTVMEIEVSGDFLVIFSFVLEKISFSESVCDMWSAPTCLFLPPPHSYLFMLFYHDEQIEVLALLMHKDERVRDATLQQNILCFCEQWKQNLDRK